MKHNCFSYSYERLRELHGAKIPNTFRGYTEKHFDYFSKNASKLLAKKIHIRYFETFCDEVDAAVKNDIILTKESIGIAINKYKYMTLRLRDGKPCVFDINKKDLIMRVRTDE